MVVSTFTAEVAQAPVRPNGGTGLDPGFSAPSNNASASVDGSG